MWEFLGGSKRVGSPPVRPAQAYTLNEQHSAPSPLLSDSHGNSPERQDGVSEPLCVLPGCASPTSSTLTEARSPPVPEEEADVFVDTLGPAVQTLTALRQADSVPSPGHSAAQPRLRAHSLSSAPLNSMTSTGSKRHIHKRLSKLLAATVNFRDVSFVTREEPAEPADVSEEGQYATLSTGVQKNKLIIIMVGLPARGKTFLCNKLMRYLNWLGHETRHFNVGQYRRKQKGDEEIQDAQFFDHSNEAGLEARNRALNAALEDLESWLMCENSQNAILDATNSTVERRQYLRQRFHGKWSYLLVESVCNDEEVLMNNYLNKMRFSPDYSGVNTQKALQDFIDRIKKYESVYTPVSVDRTYHYIQLNNMITGRAHLDVNRISGYIQGKIVFYLMQVCKSGQLTQRKIWLTRHGQSEYNKFERLGGDSCLSEAGEKYANLLPSLVLSRVPQDGAPLSVWTSTLKRTILTSRFLPFPKLQWKALDEISAGACDGMTYKEIEQQMPEEFLARKRDKLRYRYPEGESYLDVTQRLEPVITEVEREREYVCIVSHQAVLRVVYGYFMGIPQEQIPNLKIPLHTLIELTPLPDGTMSEQRFEVDITRGPEQFSSLPAPLPLPPAPQQQTKEEQVLEEAGRPGSPESATSCTLPLTAL